MDIKEFLSRIKDLPTISSVASEINLIEKKKSLTAKSLSEIINRDPALTAKVLRLANSAYYGVVREVSTLSRAVTVLGFDTIKNLALTISVFNVFNSTDEKAFDMQGLWGHSLGVGLAAKHLVSASSMSIGDRMLAEQAFVCGILHDIGKIAIARNFPDAMHDILDRVHSSDVPQHEIEKEILGFNHQRVGQALANSWNFPEDYLTVIRLHHAPVATVISANKRIMALVMGVYVGNRIAKSVPLGKSTDPYLEKVLPDALRKMGITTDALAGIIQNIKEDFGKMAQQLGAAK